MLTNNTPAQGRAGRRRQSARRQPLRPHRRDDARRAATMPRRAFRWEILVKCGDPSVAAVGATFNPATTQGRLVRHARQLRGRRAGPAVDRHRRQLPNQDRPRRRPLGDGDRGRGARAPRSCSSACPHGAEMCGPYFTPDDETLFVAVQHPGEADEDDPKAPPATFEKPVDPLAGFQARHAAAPVGRRDHQEGRRQDRGVGRRVGLNGASAVREGPSDDQPRTRFPSLPRPPPARAGAL